MPPEECRRSRGQPFIEHFRGNARLSMGLTAITAAIVGVVLNLALWFATNTLFSTVRTVDVLGGPVPLPVWSSADGFAIGVAAVGAPDHVATAIVPF